MAIKKLLIVVALLLGVSQLKAAPIVSGDIGVYSGVEWNTLTPAGWQARLSSFTAQGFGIIRHNTNVWGYIETSSGNFDWSRADWFIGYATAAGVTVVWTMSATPSTQTATPGWAPTNACPSTDGLFGASVGCSNTSTTDKGVLRRFARTFAARYAGLPVIVETPNEPDNPAQLNGGIPVSSEAVSLAKAVYEGTKEGSSTMPVWYGALAFPEGDTLPGSATTYADGGGNFFKATLKEGATSCVQPGGGTGFCGDAVSIHVYRFGNDTFDVSVPTITGHLASVGLTTIPVVVSETCDFGNLNYPAGDPVAWENNKAVWLAQQYPRLYSLGVSTVIWHTWGYGAFALTACSTCTDGAQAMTAFQNNFINKNFTRLRDVGNLRVSEWRNPTTGLKTWSAFSASGSTTLDFFGKPVRSTVYDKRGNSLGNYQASTLPSISVSSSPVIIQELSPPGAYLRSN